MNDEIAQGQSALVPPARVYADHVVDALKSAAAACVRVPMPCSPTRYSEIAHALAALMSGQTRHYHNVSHINEMFADAAAYGLDLTASEKLAIAFHDAVYDTLASHGNEEASAALMLAILGVAAETSPYEMFAFLPEGTPTCPPVICEAVVTIVLTGHHLDPLQGRRHPFAHRVLDLDLLGFSYPRDQFKERTNRLWKEVQAADPTFDLAEFGRRRVAFLQTLAKRERLFLSAEFQDLEPAARENIRLDIEELSPSLQKP